MGEDQKFKDQKLIEEYKETNALHRHQCVLMFAELTVFLVASGALLNAVASSRNLIVFVAPIGFVLAVCFISFTVALRTILMLIAITLKYWRVNLGFQHITVVLKLNQSGAQQ